MTKLGILNLCANLNKAYLEVVHPHFPVSLFMQVSCYKRLNRKMLIKQYSESLLCLESEFPIMYSVCMSIYSYDNADQW